MRTAHQKLSTFDLTIIVISLVIGMGIFRTPSEVAGHARTPLIFFLAWAAGALVSYFGALTFAEIGSRYPATGGFYKIFSFCYSPVFAFMVNWITVISNAASTAAVAIMGSEYLSTTLFPGTTEMVTQIIAFLTVLLLMAVNLLGIKVSKTVLNTLMILKLVLILVLIACAFFPVEHSEQIKSKIVSPDTNQFNAFLLCFVPVFFTYGGYQQTMNFGGDIDRPSVKVPKAISRGILVILLLYLGINYSYFQVLGIHGMASTKTLASDMIGGVFGPYAAKLVSLIMFFAIMTFVNVSILSNPRVYYAMAEDGVMPRAFLKIQDRTNVQINGVLVFCGMILLTLLFVNSFRKILEYVMFFDSISLITAASAIFILRKRRTGDDYVDLYKLKRGYPAVPVVYILIYTLVNVSVFVANPKAFIGGAVLFVLGFPMYYVLRKVIGDKG
jgi:APA family basic amino acid/polyamine antiporter